MLIKVFCTFICLAGFLISATSICLNTSPCKCVISAGSVIDLTSVGRIGYPRFYEVKSNNTNDTNLYSYNPCYGFGSMDSHTTVKSGNKECKDAAACVRTPGGNAGEFPEEHAIGIQSKGTFGTTSELSYHINYTVPGAKQKLIVVLNCSSEPDELIVESPETEENKTVVMRLFSKCACENGCSSKDPDPEGEGLSAGSKLLIAFFTILLAYFLIGIVWNFCNGAQGLELVPNYEFWNDLPKLIVEGLVFTCSCFGRKSSYGEV